MRTNRIFLCCKQDALAGATEEEMASMLDVAAVTINVPLFFFYSAFSFFFFPHSIFHFFSLLLACVPQCAR